MNENSITNKVLDAIAWGVFIVLLGAGWITSTYYQMDTGIYVALGVGVILIALNLARRTAKIAISKFSLFIGLLALALSGAGIVGICNAIHSNSDCTRWLVHRCRSYAKDDQQKTNTSLIRKQEMGDQTPARHF